MYKHPLVPNSHKHVSNLPSPRLSSPFSSFNEKRANLLNFPGRSQ